MTAFTDIGAAGRRGHDAFSVSPGAGSAPLGRIAGRRFCLPIENHRRTGSSPERGALERKLERRGFDPVSESRAARVAQGCRLEEVSRRPREDQWTEGS